MLISGLLLGFLGSLHCLSMCGPLIMAVAPKKINSKQFLARLLYNLGRILTYSILGLTVGLLGQSLSVFVSQQTLSIIAGVFILLTLILNSQSSSSSFSPLRKLNSRIRSKIGRYMQHHSFKGQFLFGVFNGLLPCGLLFLALSSSLIIGSLIESVAFMALFGLGTVPAVLFVSLAKGLFSKLSYKRFISVNTALALIVGLLFVVRGLNLGIPYLSPKIDAQHGIVNCSP